MKFLDNINYPKELRQLDESDLQQVADELRAEVISAISKTGGHLGAGLGVVELTVALHYVFDTPKDKLIWDVGHQAYPHKILTGRGDKMGTIRREGGLSGFTKRSESEYDPFGAGHSSTSISAGLGMAIARDHKGEDNEVIAVIGDGAISAGMAYEALNNAGALDSKLIVILNDNDMSIARPVGAMSAYLSRMMSSRSYRVMRRGLKKSLKILPDMFENMARKTEQYAKNITMGGNFFEEMGFYYIGPIDGHNLSHLLPVLKNVKKQKQAKPVLIHVKTEKGRGFDSPESSAEKFHAVKCYDPATRVQEKSADSSPSYTSIFADQLIKEAAKDDKIIAITAAMPSGTGLDKFGAEYPTRTYDVGIAEQHAVTFAAGLAAEGMKPFVAIYSTFLQRAYDQIIHDVDLQNLPVRFAIDRAGVVGADGATHAGSFDIAYLGTLPNIVIMCPSDEAELAAAVHTAANYDAGPIAFRYPRGSGTGVEVPDNLQSWEIGKGRVVREGKKVAILSCGTKLDEILSALDKDGKNYTVADARFAKPIDEDLITKLMQSHDRLITVEEGSIGGFHAHVQAFASKQGLDKKCQIIPKFLPAKYLDHADAKTQYKWAGLDGDTIRSLLQC